MNFRECTDKLRKYPTAAAVLVFAALFSILLVPSLSLRLPAFYMLWALGILLAAQIWFCFREDVSYKVSGIVPAWIELGIGFLFLVYGQSRDISLFFVILAVSSYAGGIIYGLKMIAPLGLLLVAAPYLQQCDQLLNQALGSLFSLFPAHGSGGAVVLTIAKSYEPSAFLYALLGMLLAAFAVTTFCYRTVWSRIFAYLPVFPLYVAAMFVSWLILRGGSTAGGRAWVVTGMCVLAILPMLLFGLRNLRMERAKQQKAAI